MVSQSMQEISACMSRTVQPFLVAVLTFAVLVCRRFDQASAGQTTVSRCDVWQRYLFIRYYAVSETSLSRLLVPNPYRSAHPIRFGHDSKRWLDQRLIHDVGTYRSNPEQPAIASGAAKKDRFQDRVVFLWKCIHGVASTCLEELWVPLENVLGHLRYCTDTYRPQSFVFLQAHSVK